MAPACDSCQLLAQHGRPLYNAPQVKSTLPLKHRGVFLFLFFGLAFFRIQEGIFKAAEPRRCTFFA